MQYALRAAFVVEDDNAARVTILPPQIYRRKEEHGGRCAVEVVITEVLP